MIPLSSRQFCQLLWGIEVDVWLECMSFPSNRTWCTCRREEIWPSTEILHKPLQGNCPAHHITNGLDVKKKFLLVEYMAPNRSINSTERIIQQVDICFRVQSSCKIDSGFLSPTESHSFLSHEGQIMMREQWKILPEEETKKVMYFIL